MNSGFRLPTSLFVLLALATALVSTVKGSDSESTLGIVDNDGFCLDGVGDGTRWSGGGRPNGLTILGSFCNKGNENVGRVESQEFLAPPALNLYLAGYPASPDRRLLLRNVESGEEREITPQTQPGVEWKLTSLPVPPEWIRKRVRLIVEDQAKGPLGWLGFSLPVLPASLLRMPVIDTHAPQGGFCPDGVYGTTKWPDGARPKDVRTWGSFCSHQNDDEGWMSSPSVNAGSDINIYIAGYPDRPGLSLALENLKTGKQFPLRVATAPAETWELHHFQLPAEWKGQLVRVIARDHATGSCGWVGFSAPVPEHWTGKALAITEMAWRILLLAAVFLLPPLAVGMLAILRGAENVRYLAVIALLTLAVTFGIYFSSGFWNPADVILNSIAALLAAAAVIAYAALAKRSPSELRRAAQAMMPRTPAFRPQIIFTLTPGERRWILVLAWTLTPIAILPAIFHWSAPQPYSGPMRSLAFSAAYLFAAGICYGIYRAESRRLSISQTISLVFLVFLLTSVINNLHGFYVDHATNYFPNTPNWEWQNTMQEYIIQLHPGVAPHSYRFLPNAIVRWMQIAQIDFQSARDLYRLIAGLLLFYAIYKYARLYLNYNGAILAMLFTAVIFPVSFEGYAGQLTDPLSHLSFVLALIFLETEEFALLLTTLLIGSLAKETVLAMAGYYLLFRRNEKHYPRKAAALCLASLVVFFGVRSFVLHGAMSYTQTSGVGLDHILINWRDATWGGPFLLTACALLPFLILDWKRTPRSLKTQTAFLFPVLFISSLLFSWLRETRNFMPLVFVQAVVAGGYFSRQFMNTAKPEPVPEEVIVSTD